MIWSGHCLHTLLLGLKMIDIVLRISGTSFNLPECNYKLYKQLFINRCLFQDCYWHVLHFVFYIFILLHHNIILSTLIGWHLSIIINDIYTANLSCAVYFNRTCLFLCLFACWSVTTITRNCVHRSSQTSLQCFDTVGWVTGKKAGCWFVGGDDLTGALHGL